MPEYGQRSTAAISDLLPGGGEGGWDFGRARVISLTFELRKEQAFPLLPDSLIRPVPAYAKVLIIDADEGPHGSHREAMLLLGAREGVQIRNVLIDSIVDGRRSLEDTRTAFGGSRRAGNVQIDESGGDLRILVSDAEGPLCAIRMGALRRCDATMLKYDALLVPGLDEAGQPALLRFGVRVPLADVEGTLSRDWEVSMPRRGTPWHALRPAYNVTAFYSEGPARYEFAHESSAVRT